MTLLTVVQPSKSILHAGFFITYTDTLTNAHTYIRAHTNTRVYSHTHTDTHIDTQAHVFISNMLPYSSTGDTTRKKSIFITQLLQRSVACNVSQPFGKMEEFNRISTHVTYSLNIY